MSTHKKPAIKRPKFGGKPKVAEAKPDKKTLEAYGGARARGKAFEERTPGNVETGFMQATPRQATGAMMGRSPPGLIASGTRKDSRKQFKPKGRKVF